MQISSICFDYQKFSFKRLELCQNYVRTMLELFRTIVELLQNYFRTIQNFLELFRTIQNYLELFRTMLELFKTIVQLVTIRTILIRTEQIKS